MLNPEGVSLKEETNTSRHLFRASLKMVPENNLPSGHTQDKKNNSPGPGSIFWNSFSDLALSPFAIPILIMQAAHPDVGAAVAQYSVFKTDPWGRLFRTGFSMMRFLYGGKNGGVGRTESRDLRKLHAHIKGIREDGTSYHALLPQTFRVVPDTFLDGVLRFREAIGQPLNADEKKQVYAEYVSLCLLFGIDRSELEDDLDQFCLYYDHLLLEVMTYNETVAFLLGDMMKFGPDIKYLPMPKRWWQAIYSRTLYPLIRTFTLGFLDPRFRMKHNIDWSERDESKYRRYLKWVRAFTNIVPRFLRYHPISLYVMLGGHGVKLINYQDLVLHQKN